MALELARSGADLAAVADSLRARDSAAGQAGDVQAGILVCIGADDPFVPAEQRLAFEQEMRAADVDWRMNVYGGGGP